MNFYYDHKLIESTIPNSWSRLATGVIDRQKANFSIVLPPPNVTGTLHLGHAWNTILQDVLVRYHYINGYNVFWASGMDHAGIATQTKFEQENQNLLTNKNQLSRDLFNQMIWNWKEIHAKKIRDQWKRLGLSLSINDERFTLDEKSVNIVLDAFIDMYHKGLVYRANKLVNWDIKLQTAISNIEVVHKKIDGFLYTAKYYSVVNPNLYLSIATTRPETMFGDVCLVVHPDDERYQKLIGQKFINPANNQAIPLIADPYVDLTFGTGVMKCTPAHDFNDYELGLKHQLPMVRCIGLDGKMLDNCQEFSGLDKDACRLQLVEKLTSKGLLVAENYQIPISLSERSNAVIEPMLSKQWFVKTSQLAQDVKRIITNNSEAIDFWPRNYSKAIFRYLEQMEDWCISRQLTWGIQLPVWYHCETGEIQVQNKVPDDSGLWNQDQDVFDTWFSSGLWPITVTNSYYQKPDNYQEFYPTSVLVTGVDILLFWVSRMMMFGAHFSHQMPFKHVYLHGLIRDHQNRKMSKSLGNGIDPQTLIDQYGADALRLFFVTYTNSGEDLVYHEQKLVLATKLLNKLWNAHLFLANKILDLRQVNFDYSTLTWPGKWILSRLSAIKEELKLNYQKFQFNLIAKKITDFIWDDFCNWFLEFLKTEELNQPNYHKLTAYLWQEILILLNPITPFITSYFYQQIYSEKDFYDQKFDCNYDYPQMTEHPWFFELVKIIRQLRSELKIKTTEKLMIKTQDYANIKEIAGLIKIVNAQFLPDHQLVDLQTKISFIVANKKFDLICDPIIRDNYHHLLVKKIEFLTAEVARSQQLLANQNFINNAAAEKVTLEKSKFLQYQEELRGYQNMLALQDQD